MADLALEPRSGLERLAVAGRHGRTAATPGVTLALRHELALASVMARKGSEAALARRVREAFGLDLLDTPRRMSAGPVAFTWAGPGHWLASSEAQSGSAFEIHLRETLAGLASVIDQSDGHTILRVSGPRTRDALAKGVLIDLHPRAFGPGDTAVTTVAHIGARFWQIDESPTYEFAVFRSFAADFWRWLTEAAAEFGVSFSGTAAAHRDHPQSRPESGRNAR